MKRKTEMSITSVLVVLVLFAAVTGCESLVESVLDDPAGSLRPASTPAPASSDPLDGYVFAYVEGLSGSYHVARIVQPASASTNDEAEVLDMAQNGEKRWARVFTTRPAENGDLAVGEVVLHQSSGFSDPDTDTLIATTWDAYYVTDVSNLFKDEIMVGSITVSSKHLRVPDTGIVTR